MLQYIMTIFGFFLPHFAAYACSKPWLSECDQWLFSLIVLSHRLKRKEYDDAEIMQNEIDCNKKNSLIVQIYVSDLEVATV